MKTKDCVAAIAGAIVAAVIIGIWQFVWTRPKWPEISEHSLAKSQRRGFAKSIQNGLIWNARTDEDHKNRAVSILTDKDINDTVIFLWNGVVKHNVYGYMYEIIFVDRTSRVWNVVYEEDVQSETMQASRSVLLGSEEISGQEDKGGFCLKTILSASSDLTESTISDVNREEPEHLILPKKLFNDIVSGKGKMLLQDKNGATLDSLRIVVVDSK